MSDNKKEKKRTPRITAADVSPVVIKRLPRYFRYLRELLREGRMRISSGELSERMQVTASQIRQDLNCFGGFGQQGYGYNVNYLYTKICELLGVNEGYTAIVIGVGHLGQALVRSSLFEKRGVGIIGAFDVDPAVIGTEAGDLTVCSMSELEAFCRAQAPDIAVLTCPKEEAQGVADRLMALGVGGIWNFTGKELNSHCHGIEIENVHIADSLMTLCYKLKGKSEE